MPQFSPKRGRLYKRAELLHDEVMRALADMCRDTFVKTFPVDIRVRVADGELSVTAEFIDEEATF